MRNLCIIPHLRLYFYEAYFVHEIHVKIPSYTVALECVLLASDSIDFVT